MEIYSQKSKKKRVLKSLITLIVLLIFAVLISGIWFVWQLSVSHGSAAQDFAIEPGAGVNQISLELYNSGVVNSRLAFETYLYLKGIEGNIKAGTYDLPSSTITELTSILLEGPGVDDKRITFIEGWTLADYAREVEKEGLASEQEFIEVVSHPKSNGFSDETFPILYSKPDSVDLEGYLFPDTYFVYKDVDANEIVKVLLNTLQQKITLQMAEDIDAQEKTLHEILTMASIIEKEVRTDRDRRIVSGLLWKRIDAGMALQVDATVNYITGDSKPAVTYDQTKIDNPYNTYLYRGLPPGPISNPSLSAIQAAVYPTESDYWFYLSTPDGETIFSKTLEEHNAAKQKYLK